MNNLDRHAATYSQSSLNNPGFLIQVQGVLFSGTRARLRQSKHCLEEGGCVSQDDRMNSEVNVLLGA